MLAALAQARGIEHLLLQPLFRQEMQAQGRRWDEIYYTCDGHFMPVGHRLVADFLYEPLHTLLAEGEERPTP